MAKKDDEQFRADMLQLIKDQQKQIDNFREDIHSLLSPVSPVEPPDSPDYSCAVNVLVNNKQGVSDTEKKRRANEVAKALRPLMEEYELAEVSARFQRVY